VAGLAIVPAFRSKRIGPLLLREYLNLLREKSNVRLIQLEVIKDNAQAFKLYSRLGFQANFDLQDFVIEDVQALPKTTEETGLTVSASDELDLTLPWLQHRTTYSWQREFSTLLNSCRGMKQHVVKDHKDEFVVALAIETAKDPVRITGFAFECGALTPQRLGRAIRAAIGNTAKGAEVRLEPDSSEVIPLLEEMQGCKRDRSLEEHHMILDLERTGGA
jgi:Acetyltransferase (GNAT) family